jgi:putative photosynthetic complex assembly protein 2
MPMSDWMTPALFALGLWWFATGAILYLDGLPRRTFRHSLLAASVLMVAALFALNHSAADQSVAMTYCSFTSALIVWGWLEMTFLMGFITGPRKQGCPEGCGGPAHFWHATEAIIHHELSILVAAIAIAAITWGDPNQTGTWTFMLLWGMRLSAKLNLHFGVRNFSEEFLPPHLSYLKSFFRRRRMNLLFPFSVTAGTIVTALLVQQIGAAGSSEATTVCFTLLATMSGLAVIEHWFMVLPLPFNALWKWGLKSRELKSTPAVMRVHDCSKAVHTHRIVAAEAAAKP